MFCVISKVGQIGSELVEMDVNLCLHLNVLILGLRDS